MLHSDALICLYARAFLKKRLVAGPFHKMDHHYITRALYREGSVHYLRGAPPSVARGVTRTICAENVSQVAGKALPMHE